MAENIDTIDMAKVRGINTNNLRDLMGIGMEVINQAGGTEASALIRLRIKTEVNDIVVDEGKIVLGGASAVALLKKIIR